MKKQFVLFLLCIGVAASAQVKTYFPPADNWERKTPTSLRIDSSLMNEATQYALTHETKFPKNLMLTQAMQFGKEPFFLELKDIKSLYMSNRYPDVDHPTISALIVSMYMGGSLPLVNVSFKINPSNLKNTLKFK